MNIKRLFPVALLLTVSVSVAPCYGADDKVVAADWELAVQRLGARIEAGRVDDRLLIGLDFSQNNLK